MLRRPKPKTLRVLAWPYRRAKNPYTRDLYDAMNEVSRGAVQIEDFRFGDAWRKRVDVVHVHWPEAAVESPSTVRAALKSVALVVTLHLMRRRGATIVWTAHNLHSHERHHPRLEAALRARFFRLVDGVIHLSPGSVGDVAREIPELDGKPVALVRHGIPRLDTQPSKQAARNTLGLDPCEVVWLTLGTIRPYKQVPSLIRAFGAARLRGSRLLVSGRPTPPEMADEMEAIASDLPDVTLTLGWMDDNTFATHLAAADALLACYAELHNSGVVVSALASGRPVLCRRSSATADLRELLGGEWVALLDGPLTPAVLREHEPWVRCQRDRPPALDQLHPDAIARATLDAYERFRRSRPATNGA